jgi:hypothetical protein
MPTKPTHLNGITGNHGRGFDYLLNGGDEWALLRELGVQPRTPRPHN